MTDKDRLAQPVRPVTVSAEVANRIYDLIRSGNLKPGDRLPSERDLAERLGVGRPAVREALRDLKARGLLLTGRGAQGTTVAGWPAEALVEGLDPAAGQGAEHLIDLMELRAAIEVQAAGLAARRARLADRQRLTGALGRMDQPLTAHEDRAFHLAVAHAGHNPLLQELTTRLGDLLHERMPVLLQDLYASPGAPDTLRHQHAAIVEAIDGGDEEAARVAMRRHLAFATRGLAQLAGSGRVIRLAFIDLDGTLLAGPRHIAERTIDAVARARDGGVDVVLASARLPRFIAPYHGQLRLATPVIACNGALLWDIAADVPLARASLDLGLAAEVVSLARGLGAIPNLESDDDWFADRVNDRILRNVERFGLRPPQEIGTIDRILASGGPADLVFVDIRDLAADAAAAARERLLRTVAGRATVTESVPGLLDIIALDASKAVMARRLARTLEVTADQVLAVGDGDNDVSLLAWAGIGVAMGNATPTAKAAADAVTSSNLRDGVAEALDRWALGPGGI